MHYWIPKKKKLPFSGKLITFEQMIRFLTDHLAGDTYYKIHREGHNLDRTRTQMKLVQSIIEQEAQMNAVAEDLAEESVRDVKWRPAPTGKMDLVVDLNFRMDEDCVKLPPR